MGDDAFSGLAKDSMSHGIAQQSAHVRLGEPSSSRQLFERCLVPVLRKSLSELEMVYSVQTEERVVLHINRYRHIRVSR